MEDTNVTEKTIADIAYYHRQGRSPTLVLVHGNSSDHSVWSLVLPHLQGQAVVAIDLRGHGRSAWKRPPAYATADYADDIRAVIDALSLADFVLVSHSNGAIAALHHALFAAPKPRAVVHIDIGAAPTPEQIAYFRQRAGTVERTFPLDKLATSMGAIDPTVPSDVFARYVEGLTRPVDGGVRLALDPETYRSWQPADLWDALPQLDCPITVVRGAHSFVMTQADADRMLALCRQASLVTLEGTGHFPMLGRPDAVAEIIRMAQGE
jgi:pimeloyl-ACP methyl ester carboxylesterase